MNQIVDAKLKASPEAAEPLKALAGTDEKRRDLQYQMAITQVKLTHYYSPVQRKLDQDLELAKMREEASRAENRQEALKAYREKRDAKLQELPEARPLIAEMETAKQELAELESARTEADQKLRRLRDTISRGKDEEVVAASKKVEEARKAEREAWQSEELAGLKKAWDEARKAQDAKVNELLNANEDAVALQKEMAELSKKSGELYQQIRNATRKTQPKVQAGKQPAEKPK